MDDLPVVGSGDQGYKINWDEIDEMSDPFGNKVPSVPVVTPKTVLTGLNPQGDGPDKPSPNQTPTKQVPAPPVRKQSTKVTSESAKSSPKPSVDMDNQKIERVPLKEKLRELSQMNPIQSRVGDDDIILPPMQGDASERKENESGKSANSRHAQPTVVSAKDRLPDAKIMAKAPHSEGILDNAGIIKSDPIAEPNSSSLLEVASAQVITHQLNESAQPVPPLTPSRVDSSTRPSSPANPHLLPGVDPAHFPFVEAQAVSRSPAAITTPLSPSKNIADNSDNHYHDSNSGSVTGHELIALKQERDELVQTISDMRRCIAEYERSLQHIIEEKERGKADVSQSVADIIAERDQAVEEVATIEKAFGDLHRRFEKSKGVIESFKQNEESLKRSIEEYKSLLQRQEQKYLALKKQAEEKLIKVTQETEASRQESESTVTRVQAALRIAELQIKSLEAQLAQKTQENVELTKICDELLLKYGGLS